MTHGVEPALPDDEPALVELWNSCLGDTHPLTLGLLRQNLEGAHRTTDTASLVVRRQARPVGWVLARAYRDASRLPAGVPDSIAEAARMLAPEAGKGGLGALCVAPPERGRGIGRRLLAAAEQHLRACGVALAATDVAPFHFAPGVPSEARELDAFLEHHGWTKFAECVDLDADVSEYGPSAVAAERLRAAPGVDLRAIQEHEELRLRAFLAAEFPGIWQLIIHEFLEAGGSLQDVIVAVERGTILGFCHVHDERSIRVAGSTLWYPLLGACHGGLGPIGIAASHRKRGLGFALLDAALVHQRRRGVRRMVIDWTTLEGFYGRAGFRVWRRYHRRRLRLGATPAARFGG